MTKAQLIKLIVPATIAQWKVDTPQHKHDGKETQLARILWGKRKSELETKYNYLKERGFVK